MTVAVEDLLDLDLELAARMIPEPLRRASRMLGRGLLRTASVWFPDAALLSAYATTSTLTLRPIALGVVGGAGGVAPVACARASLYEDAVAVASAAVKLLPLDAAVASGWLVQLGPEIESLAVTAAEGELISTSTPLLDMRAVDHANTERRLFVS